MAIQQELTLSVQTPRNMMYLWVACRKVSKPRTPHYHLAHKLLLRRLILWECSEKREQPPSAFRIHFDFALVVHVDQEDAEVTTRAALAGLQQRLCALVEDRGCVRPIAGFGVAGSDYAELLVGFIVLAFGDSERVVGSAWLSFEGVLIGLFTFRVVARASSRSLRPWWAELGMGGRGEGMLELLGGSWTMTQRYGRMLDPHILRLARLSTHLVYATRRFSHWTAWTMIVFKSISACDSTEHLPRPVCFSRRQTSRFT